MAIAASANWPIIPLDSLEATFPFYIELSPELRILAIGPSARRLLSDLRVGDEFAAHFSILRPPVQMSREGLAGIQRSMIVVESASGLQLAGQILVAREIGVLLLASPVLRSAEEMRRSGLSVEHFAPHDRTPDLLFVLQALQTSLASAKRSSHDLELANAALREAVQAKDEFLASVSHELRTPLHTIVACAELLRDDGERDGGAARVSKLASTILSAGNHLVGVVEDLLVASALNSGSAVLEFQPVQVDSLIRGSVALVDELAAAKQITLDLELNTSDSVVWADPFRLRQVLLNLLSNAVKFAPRRGRVVTAATISHGNFVVSVTDDGPGIPEADHERIFTKYSRSQAASARVPGSGLGLYIARSLIRLHSGNLTLVSELGRGSTFTFAIPVRQRQDLEAVPDTRETALSPAESQRACSSSGSLRRATPDCADTCEPAVERCQVHTSGRPNRAFI